MLMFIDIKQAVRQLFKAPKFTAMTLAVLIGGLSISLFTFSFFYSTVYKPLPLPEGQTAKIVSLWENGEYERLTAYDFKEMEKVLDSVEEFGVFNEDTTRLSIEQAGKSFSSAQVRAGFFEFGRIKPIKGRGIRAEDTVVGATPVALVSEGIWRNELNAIDDVIGSTVMLDGVKTEIIGVMPEGYRFPNIARIWKPLPDEVFKAQADQSPTYRTYTRLKEGVSIGEAEQEMTQAVRQLHQEKVALYHIEPADLQIKLLTFQMDQTGGEGGVIFAFINGVTWVILMLACINVGNLLLSRILEKQKETSIRSALGAPTRRLISQLMWEGVIISVVGGLLSVLLVGGALDYTNKLLQSWIPSGGSFWWRYGMDTETIVMAIVYTVVTIVFSTFIPAWRSVNQDINTTLRDGTRGAQGKKAGRLSRILVTTQVFLVALLMLIGSISAFIAHSFINMEMGDDYSNVISARFQIPENKYPEDNQLLNVTLNLLSQLRQHPNVEDVVINNWWRPQSFYLNGVEYHNENEVPSADVISAIGPLSTVGVNLKMGRDFALSDTTNTRKVVIISESMAKRYWPNESPLEKSFALKVDDKKHQVFVVGVVSNRMNPSSLFGSLDSADEIYVSGTQFISSYQVLLYRVRPNTENADEIFYRAMFNTDRNIELTYAVEAAEKNRNKMRESMGVLSDVTFGTGFFALLLALVGIYGLTANAVTQRTHEVGIRRAVGATDSSITLMFMKQGGKQLAIGLGLSLVLFALLAVGFHRFTEELFPVMSYYVLAIVVTLGLSVVVLFAIYIPTKRAIAMEPSTALRYE